MLDVKDETIDTIIGEIVFDEKDLCPQTTMVPDEWELLYVTRQRISESALNDYEIWNIPSWYVVFHWSWTSDKGYGYPAVKVFSNYAQVEKYLDEER